MEKEAEDISVFKIFLISMIFTVLSVSFVYFFYVPQIDDVPLDTESKIYAGEGEACNTPTITIECDKGLECIDLSNKPYRNGVCLPEGTIIKEDFTNRKDNPGEQEGLDVVEWKGDTRTQ